MLLSVLTALVLAQGSPSMAGPGAALISGNAVPNTFTTILSSTGTECANQTLTATGGETLTFTRASDAYCTAVADGAMTTRTSNQPRVSSKGVFIEGARTNILLRSEALDNAAWSGTATMTADQAAPPWGGSTMDEENSPTSANARYQCPTIASSAGPFAFSAYGRAPSGTQQARLDIICVASNANTDCDALRDDGAAASSVESAGVCPGSSTFSTTVDRMQTTTTCDAAKTQVCPSPWGGVPAPGIMDWGGLQAEVAPFASSYIPTAGTSATRAADDLHFTPSVGISSQGCVAGTVTFGPVAATNGRLIGGAAATGIYVADADTITISDGANTVSVDPGANLATQAYAFKATWAGSSMTLTVNGVSASGTFDGDLDLGTIYLGSQAGTSNHLFGWLKSLKFGASAGGCL